MVANGLPLTGIAKNKELDLVILKAAGGLSYAEHTYLSLKMQLLLNWKERRQNWGSLVRAQAWMEVSFAIRLEASEWIQLSNASLQNSA